MNENILVTFINGDLKDTSGAKVTITDQFSENILLDPYYCTEDDIISIFMQDKEKYWLMTKKIIFDSQVKVDFMFRKATFIKLDEQEIFHLKRDYVICSSTYQFAKQFNSDFLKSVSKTKMLGDLKVSVRMDKAINGANLIMGDAEKCLEELQETIKYLSDNGGSALISTWVKGANNGHSNIVGREWYPGEPMEPMIPIATRHYEHLKKFYKVGIW